MVRISRWLSGEPPLGWAAHTYFHDIRGKRSGYSTRAGRQPMIVVQSEIGQCDDEGRWIGQATPRSIHIGSLLLFIPRIPFFYFLYIMYLHTSCNET